MDGGKEERRHRDGGRKPSSRNLRILRPDFENSALSILSFSFLENTTKFMNKNTHIVYILYRYAAVFRNEIVYN